MKSPVIDRTCAVCGVKGDGIHFGAETCRACAAFFRRTVAFQRNYKCRANGNCNVEEYGRCSCKSCRFNKCRRVGMRTQAIRSSTDEPTGSPCRPTIISPQETKSFFDMNEKMPCLWRIQGNYFQLYNIRRVMHKKDQQDPPRTLNHAECVEQYTQEIGVTRNFLENAYPDYKELPFHQKNVLFKNFYASFLLLEPGYFSQLHKTDDWIMASGDLVSWSKPETFYHDIEESVLVTKEQAIRLYDSNSEFYKRNSMDSWRRFEVKDIEFYALISFVLWEVGLEGQTLETEIIAERCRKEITQELVYYYLNVLKDLDYGMRMTNLMSLLRTNERALRKWQEDTEIGKFFNAYGVGDTLYDIIMMR